MGSMHSISALLRKARGYYPYSTIFIGGSHVYVHYKKLLNEFAQFVDFALSEKKGIP